MCGCSRVQMSGVQTSPSLAWRHIFDADEHIIRYKQRGDGRFPLFCMLLLLTTETVVAAVSGTGGATLRLLDVNTGYLLAERHLHKPEAGRLFEPETLGTTIVFDEGGDWYILSNAHIVRRIDGETGDVKWVWSAPDQT